MKTIYTDARKVSLRQMAGMFNGKWLLSGNLPFNIATPLLLMWMRESALNLSVGPSSMTLMFQREVGEV